MIETYEELRDQLCRDRFDAFAQKAFSLVEPGTPYEWSWHIGCISEHLEALFNDEISRLIINLPPRSLKSYLVSSAFPAWVMGKKANAKFINTGYGFEVVEQNAIKCRKIMGDPWYKAAFPKTVVDNTFDRRTHFMTTQGGQYYATTALSAVTGVGCHYMTIDDPIKPMEAISDQVRNSVNQNIRSTLLNRFDDKRVGKLLIVMQRSHVDDATGHLMQDKGYTVVKLPAETKSPISITLPNRGRWEMKEGELLFPARLGRKELDQTRLDMTEYHYAGQYLQEPVPIGGGEFKPSWVQYYAQGSIKPKEMNVAIIVDQAGGEELNKKKKKLSDWSTILTIGLATDNNYYVLDMVRDRFNPTDRIETIFLMHRKWNEICGKPPKVGCEQIGLMTDTHYLREKQKKDAYHFPVCALGAGQKISKEERIRKLIPIMQTGRWYMPQSLTYIDYEGRHWDLVKEFIDVEMGTFPKSRYDDLIDGACRILDEELAMTFPGPKLGSVAKARREAHRTDDNWENW